MRLTIASMRAGCSLLVALAALCFSGVASAFVYPEHRDIAVLAVQGLDPARRAVFDGLWRDARVAHESRLCADGADAAQSTAPTCIDWAALAAISGDHSCSSEELTKTVLDSDWILAVADVAAQLKIDLSRIDVLPSVDQMPGSKEPIQDIKRRVQTETARAERQNALRTADIRLQRADAEYATRAGANNAHFLLARPRTGTTVQEYGQLVLTPGSDISAVGVYAWYHLSAMEKATRLANEQFTPEERGAVARAMLFDEAFALHFLEDTFAAGHVAGTWGNTAQRKGTHDYYNETGLEAFTWSGGSDSTVLMGDAHMRPEDAERAAVTVRESVAQLLDAVAGKSRAANLPHTPGAPLTPESLNVCKTNNLPKRPEPLPEAADDFRHLYVADLGEVLRPTPVPGLGPGLGAMPRFRSEVGPFFGLSGAIDGRSVDGGFTPADGKGFVGGVDLAFRGGLGLDGVMSDSGDGLVFLSLGLRGDSASSNKISDSTLATAAGNLAAAVPARMGVSTRLRMPYYVIPGDLLLMAPLYFISPKSYTAMAVTSGNGGLLHWQSAWATGIGRFQFVLGREIGVTFYGAIGDDRVIAPPETAGGQARIVSFHSTAYDFPILEYRPYRSFASNQSSTVMVQLFANADVPHSEKVTAPVGAVNPDLKTIWSFGLRLVFDWRYYP